MLKLFKRGVLIISAVATLLAGAQVFAAGSCPVASAFSGVKFNYAELDEGAWVAETSSPVTIADGSSWFVVMGDFSSRDAAMQQASTYMGNLVGPTFEAPMQFEGMDACIYTVAGHTDLMVVAMHPSN